MSGGTTLHVDRPHRAADVRAGKTASKEMIASPNVNGSSAPRPPLLLAAIVDELIEPKALFAAVRSTAGPQSEPVQCGSRSSAPYRPGRVVRDQLSPTVRRGVSGVTPTPLFAQFVGVALGSQNSGSARSPCSSCPAGSGRASRRAPGTCRSRSPRYRPKVERSLLLFGIEPSMIVGFGSSSFVPWPKESSELPVACRFGHDAGPERAARPIREPVNAVRLPLTTRFRVGVDSKLLPAERCSRRESPPLR